MLILALAALTMPAVFELVKGGGLPLPGDELVTFDHAVEELSLTVAIVLLLAYAGGLWFSLISHRDLFNPPDDEEHERRAMERRRSAVIVLAVAGLAVGLMSEILVGSIAHTAESIGLSEFFIGAVIVAVVGNAAEHWVAVYVAAKDKMDLAINIAVGSAAQVALFVGPVLVVISFFVGPNPLALVFNGFELAGIVLAVIVASHVTSQGESTWFEGLMLLALYVGARRVVPVRVAARDRTWQLAGGLRRRRSPRSWAASPASATRSSPRRCCCCSGSRCRSW